MADNHTDELDELLEFGVWCKCGQRSCQMSRNYEQAKRQIEDFYRNKIPERLELEYEDSPEVQNKKLGYNKAVRDITAQFNSRGSDEH